MYPQKCLQTRTYFIREGTSS